MDTTATTTSHQSRTLLSTGRPARTTTPRVTVVVPAMNEARNLEIILPELLATATNPATAFDLHEIILIDGGSTDDTIATARAAHPDIVVLQQTRKGKGNALAAGFAHATGDIIVMFDADGSADPTEIPTYLNALTNGADFAKGSRFTTGGGSSDITPIRHLGNLFLNTVMNLGFHTHFTDLCYGYNAFWADLVHTLDLPDHTTPAPTNGDMLWGDGFEIETLINARFAAADVTITEVPSIERLRIHGASNLHAIKDGLRVLNTLRTEHRRARHAGRTASTTTGRATGSTAGHVETVLAA